MTRSFIDDGTISNNPFAVSTENRRPGEDSFNDLNKTHELSDYDADQPEIGQDLE